MAISITKYSQIEISDWLGGIGTTRRRGMCFLKYKSNTTLDFLK
jgi:hypothetical protein